MKQRHCTVSECFASHYGKGFCRRHYDKNRNHGDPTYVHKRKLRTCSVVGCGSPHYGKGLCKSHRVKEWFLENRERVSHLAREWRAKNRNRIREHVKQYNAVHRAEINKYRRKYENYRYRGDLSFRLRVLLRSRLRHILKKQNLKLKRSATIELLDCSITNLVKHIENQFHPHPLTGQPMNWEGHGTLWDIDHVRPLGSFDLSDPGQLKMATRFSNLQPLWKSDHYVKTKTDIQIIRAMRSA